MHAFIERLKQVSQSAEQRNMINKVKTPEHRI